MPSYLKTLFGAGAAALVTWLLLRPKVARAEAMPTAVDDLRFRMAIPSEAQPYADAYLRAGRERRIEPFLLVAIAMRESRSGAALVPPGPAGKGDYGHGHGIMQIDDRSHAEWLAANDWTDPLINIRKGADILRGKMRFFSGREEVKGLVEGGRVSVTSSVAARLGVAPGAYPDPRPLAGPALVRAAVAAYNAGEGRILQAIAAGKDPDSLTANYNYSSDVLSRAAAYLSKYRSISSAVT